METANTIDMSLDEIIKLQRKSKSAVTSRGRVARGRSTALRTSIKRGVKAPTLRPHLGRQMKSRQASVALAIFQKARRTAAIAARVAADAAAFVSPSTNFPRDARILLSAAGNRRNQRPINRGVGVNRKIMAVNRRIFQRQRQQAMQNNRQMNSQGGFINWQRDQLQTQQRQFGNRNNQLVDNQRPNQQQRFNSNNNTRGLSRRRAQVGFRNRIQRPIPTNNGSNSSGGGQRYHQYIQQARALIRAQNEGGGGGNFYVDSPAGGRNGRRGGRGGRFRR